MTIERVAPVPVIEILAVGTKLELLEDAVILDVATPLRTAKFRA